MNVFRKYILIYWYICTKFNVYFAMHKMFYLKNFVQIKYYRIGLLTFKTFNILNLFQYSSYQTNIN